MPIKRNLFAIVIVAGLTLATGLAAGPGGAAEPDGGGPTPDEASGISSLLGPEYMLCCNNEYHQGHPSVAYNRIHREYLVVHHTDDASSRIIIGVRVQLGIGQVMTFLTSGNSAGDALYPDVAYSWTSDKYLVVWQQYNAAQSRWEIYGRFIPWDGMDFTILPFKIAEVSNRNLKYPAVAWNSYNNEYVVVWQTENSSGQLVGIGRRRVRANGSMPEAPGYVREIANVGSPDITYSPAWNEYLAVWVEPGSTSLDIYGGRLGVSGALLDQIFPVSQASGNQQLPAVTTNEQAEYLVVWEDQRLTDDSDIRGQFLEVNGDQLGSEFFIGASYDNDTHPAVTANGGSNQYLAVWQRTTDSGERISGRLRKPVGGWLGEFEVVPDFFGQNEFPAVATHLSGYFATYGWRGSVPSDRTDIYGRSWSPQARFLPLVLRNY